jgi:hypothetical protein
MNAVRGITNSDFPPGGGVAAKRPREECEARVRRAAEREGRRTRRRRHREAIAATLGNVRHQDGMSSDDEVTDLELNAFRAQMRECTTVYESTTIKLLEFSC